MLTIYSGQRRRGFCDRASRRDFLRIGSLAVGGLTLPQLLRAETASGRPSHKAVIMVYLPGGPPHQDTFDIKTAAPSDVRGEFLPIDTRVPGVQICELLPRMAARMDKLVAIRSVVGSIGDHASFQCLTGRTDRRQPTGGWPEMGSLIARLQGPTAAALPPFVGLSPKMQHRPYNSGKPGFLGPAYAPFQPNGEGKDDLVLKDLTIERLADRRQLNAALDRLRGDLDTQGMMDGLDTFKQQAFGVLGSSKLAEALDVSRERPEVLERYGRGTAQHQGDGAPRLTEHFLIARRLVEAGVRCVSLSFSFWDWHGQNFQNARTNLPVLDQAVTATGRRPIRAGPGAGRGRLRLGRVRPHAEDQQRRRTRSLAQRFLRVAGRRRAARGQVIGSTDRQGAEAKDRPVHFQEVLATLYHTLGIDANQATVPDMSGRPQYLLDGHQPIHELI